MTERTHCDDVPAPMPVAPPDLQFAPAAAVARAAEDIGSTEQE